MLTGAHVTLRAITPEDHDALFALEADLATWELRRPVAPVPLDRGTWEARLADRLAGTDGAVRFAVEADGSFAGTCMLAGIDPLARHAAVGISLASHARGRGLGTDALRVLVAFAFRRHNLRRLHLEVLARNTAAIAAYGKAGFVLEGRRREHAWVDGGYEDDLVMGLLRADWAAAPASS